MQVTYIQGKIKFKLFSHFHDRSIIHHHVIAIIHKLINLFFFYRQTFYYIILSFRIICCCLLIWCLFHIFQNKLTCFEHLKFYRICADFCCNIYHLFRKIHISIMIYIGFCNNEYVTFRIYRVIPIQIFLLNIFHLPLIINLFQNYILNNLYN